MTSALETIRYHSGIAGEEVADMVDSLEREVSSLREQVEKLTMERDTEIARNRPLQSLIKSTEETKSFLLKKSEENKEAVKQLDSERQANAVLTEELAALAEQNEKLRAVLDKLARLGNEPYLGNSIGNRIAAEALSLPDLASPVLNRIRADGVRKASTLVSLVRNDWASAGDTRSVQAAEYLIYVLDARAAELENEDAN